MCIWSSKPWAEDGKRLNIRKATLRQWREAFAEQLRAQGVKANATERAVRGRSASTLKDGIYRTALRRESRYVRSRVEHVVDQLRGGGLETPSGKSKLLETRRAVVNGWYAAADALLESGNHELAAKIWRFVGEMRPPLTADERVARRFAPAPPLRDRGAQERTR